MLKPAKKLFKKLSALMLIASVLVSSPILDIKLLNSMFFSYGSFAAEAEPEITIYAGGYSVFAKSDDGEVKTWGYNYYGNLGLGYFSEAYTPLEIADLRGVKELAVGGYFGYALMEDGTVMAWGYNSNGQLGIGNTEHQLQPVPIPGLTGVKKIYAGYYHAFAVLENGTVKGWGRNDKGQLGIGNTEHQLSPVTVSGITNVKKIACGGNHTLFLMNDGYVKACGYNIYGQLGINDTTDRSSPVSILSGVTDVSAGSSHSMALSSNGTVYAWGYNSYGQLGVGHTSNQSSPQTVPALSGVIEIGSGNAHSYALLNNGTVKAWGYNGYGQLGIGNTENQLTPVQITGISSVQSISAGRYSTFLRLSDGSVKACGWNTYGQLGIGGNENRLTPVNVPSMASATQIAAGYDFTLALKPDKRVLACGSNSYGQICLPGKPYINTPVPLEGISEVKKIAESINHSIFLMNDGTLKSCGYNNYAQLGHSDRNNRNTPADIMGLANVRSAAAGYYHSLAVMQNGTVKAWGHNAYGQLGIGNTTDSSSPVTVANLSNVKDIAAGSYHSIALLNDGTVKASGYNYYGQLGLGNTTNQLTPVTIPGLSNVKKVVSGYYYNIALLNDGTLKAWGDNNYGQLGIGNTANQLSPVTVPGISGVKDIAAGGYYTIALMEDGSVKAWGQNNYGQLGLGNTNQQNSPVAIPELTGVLQIAASISSSYAALSDGTVKAWGYNSYGQLGAGDQQNRLTPTTVPVEFKPPVPTLDGIFIHATEDSVTVSDSKNSKEKNLFRFTLGNDTSGWLDAAAFPDEIKYTFNNLSPNTSYPVKVEIKNTEEQQTEKTYDISTKAQRPGFTIACEGPGEMIININDGNPVQTDYLIQLDSRYVSSLGTLASSEEWLRLPDKSINICGLDANRTYQVRVRARNNDGIETEFTDMQQASTSIQAPLNLTAVSGSDSVDLIWDEVPGASGYEVEADGDIYSVPDNLYFTHGNLLPETTHVYRVRAKNSQYTGAWSAELVAEIKKALPRTPANLALTATSTTVTAVWDEVPGGGVVYELEVDGKIVRTDFKSSYLHINLPTYSRHTYRVRAVNSTGASPWSEAETITTQFLPPRAIEGLSAVEAMTKIVITWDKVPDASKYIIEIDGEEIDNGRNTYWIIYGKPGSDYTFRVKAVNPAGESVWSQLQVRTYSLETPMITDIIESQHEVTLTWGEIEGADEYSVERNGQIIGTALDAAYTDTDLTAETKYTYRIKAVGQDLRESNLSCPMEALTLPEKPSIPTGFYVGGTNGLIVISWDAVDGAIGYDLEIDGVLIENGSGTIYKYKDIFTKTTHTYRVRARNSGIEGDWHDGISFTTLPDTILAPADIHVESLATITNLTWKPVPDAVKYEVEVDGAIACSGARTDFSHRRIEPNVEHVYRLRSIGYVDTSPWSARIVNNSVRIVCDKGRNAQIGLTASDVTDFSGYTLTVVYNKDVMEVDDLCTLTTEKELNAGKITGSDVEVIWFEPGKIVFKVDKPIELGKSWSGIINRIGFKGRVTGGTTITYTVFIEPKPSVQ